MTSQPTRFDTCTYPQPFASDVLSGLTQAAPRLPFQYFYDDTGCRLFSRVCSQPEYYITRTETAIMRDNASAIANAVGKHVGVIELGSGSGPKTRFLLDRLDAPAWFVPVDISRTTLTATTRALRSRYPALPIRPIQGDFTEPFQVPTGLAETRRLCFAPGLTLWNLNLAQRQRLMRNLSRQLGRDGALLVGVDWIKDPELLEAAYDDSEGVTARFNLNMLERINRELGGTFSVEDFRHHAHWDASAQRVEVRLVAQRHVSVSAAGRSFDFRPGQAIVTEHCYKFSPKFFPAHMKALGWSVKSAWSDDDDLMSIVLLQPARS